MSTAPRCGGRSKAARVYRKNGYRICRSRARFDHSADEGDQRERLQTNADIAALQGQTGQLAAQIAAQPDRIPTASKTADNPQLLNQLKGTMLTLQLKRTQLLNQFDPHYRLVQDVDREIATTQANRRTSRRSGSRNLL